MLITNPDLSAKPSAAGGIRDATTESFERDALQKSMEKPVIVDFWAQWCGPCRTLMPMLEKAVAETKGAVEMVRVDVDKNPELAQIFRVQSLPMVYAFFQGQPVDGFVGQRPESEVKAFVAKLAKLAGAQQPAAQGAVDAAKLLAEGDAFFSSGDNEQAMERYGAVLDAEPENMAAMAGIGWALLALGEVESVREMTAGLTPEQKAAPRMKGLVFVLEKGAEAETLPDEQKLEQAAADKKNLQALYDLALKRIARADFAGAIDSLADLTKRNREWEEQKARRLFVDLLEAMGPQHPLTSAGRRKLSSVLFS